METKAQELAKIFDKVPPEELNGSKWGDILTMLHEVGLGNTYSCYEIKDALYSIGYEFQPDHTGKDLVIQKPLDPCLSLK